MKKRSTTSSNSGWARSKSARGPIPGNALANPAVLLASERRLKAFREAIERRGLVISALSCHGNPLHPQPAIAKAHHKVFEQTVELASKLGVENVITFSGCPGSDAKATTPSWVVSPWPPEFAAALDWQWKDRVVPYWKQTAALCRKAGVRVAIEMHPNFVVYNPETMNRLRAIAPSIIGCNFDPSHMFWQGIDPVAAIRAIGDGVFHFHAKDCKLDRGEHHRQRRARREVVHPRTRALVDLPHRRLRQRRAGLEGHGQHPAPRRLRPRAQHRARRQPDVGHRRV